MHGIKLNSIGPAKSYINEKNSSVKYISGQDNIREKSIAVKTSGGGGNGHVMFIEYVERDKKGNPTYVYLTQANYDANNKYDAGIDGRLEKWSWEAFKESRDPVGYIVKK